VVFLISRDAVAVRVMFSCPRVLLDLDIRPSGCIWDPTGDTATVDIGEIVEHRKSDELIDRHPEFIGFVTDRLPGEAVKV